MIFSFDYDTQPKKFLKHLDKHIALRIIDKIETTLANNPVPHDAKAIFGEHGVFRVRIGDYRALYRIIYQTERIIIIKIDKREHAYD
jgi:mRNA interferase RelE/StbE